MNIGVGSNNQVPFAGIPFGSEPCEKQALPRSPILLRQVVVGAAGLGWDNVRMPSRILDDAKCCRTMSRTNSAC